MFKNKELDIIYNQTIQNSQNLSLILQRSEYILFLGPKLETLIHKLKLMSETLDKLVAQVKSNNDTIDSAVTLIRGIKQKLDDAIASGDPTKLNELSDSLGAKDAELAQAITDNTPAETPPAG